MPRKYRIKNYQSSGYYHLFNRGVEKRSIFTTENDYQTFLGFLQEYFQPKDVAALTRTLTSPYATPADKQAAVHSLSLNNFSNSVSLLAYCLMPNHFHLLVKQNQSRGIEKLMRSLQTRYVRYFNRVHNFRTGNLFEDTYKAVIVNNREDLLQLSKYIHRKPMLSGVSLLDSPQPSSLKTYLQMNDYDWVCTSDVLNNLSVQNHHSYLDFVNSADSSNLIADLTIDSSA